MPSAPLLAGLEERELGYVFRLATNPVLRKMAEPCLHRPRGRPPREPRVWCHELVYAAES